MLYKQYSLKMTYQFFINYSYLIVEPNSRNAIVIDPAWELEKITKLLKKNNAKLRAILLTHSHYDHTNLVPTLSEAMQPDVFLSQKEINASGFRCERLHAINDNDSLSLGGLSFRCLLTPGHTTGSMCFYLGNSLFTGDTLFTEGCGVCIRPGGSPEAMYSSIQRLKREIKNDVCIFPGHSFGMPPGQTMEHLRKNNIYLQLNREHFIKFRMRKNQLGLFDFQ
ncbi:MBL fold metallo-hydrolase [Gracilibacillus dipsosauri]|uniref:MBL fold metallo-hydrolase n=1 Tax=Gracilibacillus dipsosauri TaxID=178340 RepID=A0A317KUZ8_9BACI|nr:MBL fold metallo-hydrolase [Gracilibacillus dipsosauri]PWU67371.1 MBL fold metallo-hydrolase [Gracilibacillus dipsosauri]